MEPLAPIETVDLFPPARAALVDLLAGLTDAEWERPTVCPGWSVKDVALHLLGGDVSILSGQRDRFAGARLGTGTALLAWDDLVPMINRHNAGWVEATRRISPRLLVEFLGFTGEAVEAHFRGLDLAAVGGSVDSAGPAPTPVWLDVAREYTERWVHQQQIRDAIGRPGLTERRWLAPVLDAFARALPHALRDISATGGTLVRLVVTGEAGGTWQATRSGGDWLLARATPEAADAVVTMDQDLAWRLFTRGVDPAEARPRVVREGDPALVERVMWMVSIIA